MTTPTGPTAEPGRSEPTTIYEKGRPMSIYDTYVRDRLENANDAYVEAQILLITALENGEEIADAVTDVAHKRAVASWWDTAVTAIDHEGTDPVDALVEARELARRTLTDQPIPSAGSLIKQGVALVRIEAARFFYQATKHLDEITVGSTS